MYKELLNFDFEHRSDKERWQWFLHIVPFVQKFLVVGMKHFVPKGLSCEDCTKKAECAQRNQGKKDITCLILEPHLPKRYEGTGYREKNMGLLIEEFTENGSDIPEEHDHPDQAAKPDRSTLNSIRKIRSDEEFMRFKNCITIFSPEQLEVILLKFENGMKYREIGEFLTITTSAVSDRFQRAKKRLAKYYGKGGHRL